MSFPCAFDPDNEDACVGCLVDDYRLCQDCGEHFDPLDDRRSTFDYCEHCAKAHEEEGE